MNKMTYALPLMLLGACNMTVDDANDQVTVEYDQNLAENTAADVANGAQDLAGTIANDVGDTVDAVDNRVIIRDADETAAAENGVDEAQ